MDHIVGIQGPENRVMDPLDDRECLMWLRTDYLGTHGTVWQTLATSSNLNYLIILKIWFFSHPSTFQAFNSLKCMVIILDRADIKPFHYCRKFNRTALI